MSISFSLRESHLIKPVLMEEITKHLHIISKLFTHHSIHSDIVFNILYSYIEKGKMLRARLYLYWIQAYHNTIQNKELLSPYMPIAVAIELLQAFLLIHDDIIDNDNERRGVPSMHVQMKNIIESRNLSNTESNPYAMEGGKGLAICIGDILHAYIFDIVATHTVHTHCATMTSLFSRYIMRVGVGQMDDVYWSSLSPIHALETIDDQAVLNMYKRKTGDYTFTLPSLLGLYSTDHINGDLTAEQSLLQDIGDSMGIIYQIRDDIIDIRYGFHKTGKPQGSDFINKKHTYLLVVLLQQARLQGVYTNIREIWKHDIGEEEKLQLLQYTEHLEVYHVLYSTLETQYKNACNNIDTLQIEDFYKQELKEYMMFMMSREK